MTHCCTPLSNESPQAGVPESDDEVLGSLHILVDVYGDVLAGKTFPNLSLILSGGEDLNTSENISRELEDRHFNLIWCFIFKLLILERISFHKDFSGGKFQNRYLMHTRL